MIETKTEVLCNGLFDDFIIVFSDTKITTAYLEE